MKPWRLLAILPVIAISLASCKQTTTIIQAPSSEPPAATASAVPSGGPSATETPGTGAAAVPEGWKTCSNAVYGYTIAYPGTWFTTDTLTRSNGTTFVKPSYACTLFDPKPFSISAVAEPPVTAMAVFEQQQGVGKTVSQLTDPRYQSVVSQRSVTVAGMPAVRLEVDQSGQGYYPAGTLQYLYVVGYAPGRTLEIFTMYVPRTRYSAARGTDYDTNKGIIDQAAATLTFP